MGQLLEQGYALRRLRVHQAETAPLYELIDTLLRGAPTQLRKEFERSDKAFRIWVDLSSNWSLSTDKDRNELELRKAADGLRRILSVLAADPRAKTIVVADTNSLLANPDPVQYRGAAGTDTFEFVLLPTVLRELDELKVLHRNPDVREKAQKVISRIKGWRAQGSLMIGVTVDKTITVRAIHTEPNVKESLSWLDPDVPDDRIVANILDLQAVHPTARVLLITGDINLQNKADAALIEVGEV